MKFLDYLRMILTGLVSGAARMLPVSDSAHAILLSRLFGNTALYTDRFLMLCYAVAGLGSAFALAFTFFNKLNVFSQYKTDDQKRNTQDLVRKMLLSSVPFTVIAAVFELLLPEFTAKVFMSPFMAAGMLILFGIFGFFYLFAGGPVVMPRYQIPALPLLCAMAGSWFGLFRFLKKRKRDREINIPV